MTVPFQSGQGINKDFGEQITQSPTNFDPSMQTIFTPSDQPQGRPSDDYGDDAD